MTRPIRSRLLLTGAAEGLGAGIAETFARAGHDVVGLSRTHRSTEHLARRVEQAGRNYIHLTCDLTQPAAVVAAIEPHAGGIDVLIHNGHLLDIKPFEQTSADAFEQAWRVVVRARSHEPISTFRRSTRQQGTHEMDLRAYSERF